MISSADDDEDEPDALDAEQDAEDGRALRDEPAGEVRRAPAGGRHQGEGYGEHGRECRALRELVSPRLRRGLSCQGAVPGYFFPRFTSFSTLPRRRVFFSVYGNMWMSRLGKLRETTIVCGSQYLRMPFAP